MLPGRVTGINKLFETDSQQTSLRAGSAVLIDSELDLSFLNECPGTGQSDFESFLLAQFASPVESTSPRASEIETWWERDPSAPERVRTETQAGLTKDSTQLRGALAADRSALPETRAAPHLPGTDAAAGAKVSWDEEGGKEEKGVKGVEALRQAQKRSRQKAKERAHDREVKLANAVTELCQLQAQHQQLQARNILLEKLARINRQGQGSDAEQKFGLYDVSKSPGNDQAILTTVHGIRQHLSMEAASTMQFERFRSIWTDYIRELGRLLVVQSDTGCNSAAVTARLQQVTIEASQLLGVIQSLNIAVYKAVTAGRLDEEQASDASAMSDEHHDFIIAVMNLSEQQVQDVLYLRSLYLTRRGLLAVEKDALCDKIRQAEVKPKSSSELQEAREASTRLRAVAAEDYTAYLKIACSLRRGVLSTEQWAVKVVHAYPWFPSVEVFLEILARQNGAPTLMELLSGAGSHDCEAGWQALDSYIALITSSYHAEHVAVPRAARAPAQHTVQTPAPLVSLHAMLM